MANSIRTIQVFDTSLRDGEQAAGSRLGAADKLEVARQLARLNVDVIEAGFPISSPEDFEAVRIIGEEVEGPTICGLTRAVNADIEAAGKALKKALKGRIHTGLGVSDIHVERKLRKTKPEVLRMGVEAVQYAREFVDDVEFYAEDAGRADKTFLKEILGAAIEAGASVINIPDTTGYTMPEQWAALIKEIIETVPGMREVTVSIHCHNDLGLAVANTLAGVKAGATQIEGTLNGIGERAGNASLEECVMAIRTRVDYFGCDTRINANEIYRTSQLVAQKLGMFVPANKAVVGSNAFAHSSGIHVDGFLKDRETYEIMQPEDVGFPQSRVVLTARTGRHGLRHRLAELGYELKPDEVEAVYQTFLEVADKKREVYDEDLIAIMGDEVRATPGRFELEYIHTLSGTGTVPTATVRIKDGERAIQEAAWGDGPVDAAYKAIKAATRMQCRLKGYQIRAVTAGAEALGEVSVHVVRDERTAAGRAVSTDVIEASAKAFLDAINRLVAASEAESE